MLVAADELIQGQSLQLNLAPEPACVEVIRVRRLISNLSESQEKAAREVYSFLRIVRLAGGWCSYVTEERRALATVMALWKKRQRRENPADPPHLLTRGAASTLFDGDSGAPSYEDAPRDVWEKVFKLPTDVAGHILRLYTDLVL